MNYPEKVKRARPWFIASYRLSNNPRIHDLLFPMLDGPRGKNGEYFGTPWHDISIALYDLEGLILSKDWLSNDHIFITLEYTLASYESSVWIFPWAVQEDDNTVPPKSLGTRRLAAGKRFWVFVLHRHGNHWALAVYDQLKCSIFLFDSMAVQNARKEQAFKTDLWRLIHEVSDIPPARPNPLIYTMKSPRQTEDWECGIWVLEFARFFFQEVQDGHNLYSGKRWIQSRLYCNLGKRHTPQMKMLRCWTEFIRASLGSYSPSPQLGHPQVHLTRRRYPRWEDPNAYVPPPWPAQPPPAVVNLSEDVDMLPPPPATPKTPGPIKDRQQEHPPVEATSLRQIDEHMDIDAFVTDVIYQLDDELADSPPALDSPAPIPRYRAEPSTPSAAQPATPTRRPTSRRSIKTLRSEVLTVMDLQNKGRTTEAMAKIDKFRGWSSAWSEQGVPAPLFDSDAEAQEWTEHHSRPTSPESSSRPPTKLRRPLTIRERKPTPRSKARPVTPEPKTPTTSRRVKTPRTKTPTAATQWRKPPIFDCVRAPELHWEPRNPAWFEGWTKMDQDIEDWKARERARRHAAQQGPTREERMAMRRNHR
jgi:hypothetical protein